MRNLVPKSPIKQVIYLAIVMYVLCFLGSFYFLFSCNYDCPGISLVVLLPILVVNWVFMFDLFFRYTPDWFMLFHPIFFLVLSGIIVGIIHAIKKNKIWIILPIALIVVIAFLRIQAIMDDTFVDLDFNGLPEISKDQLLPLDDYECNEKGYVSDVNKWVTVATLKIDSKKLSYHRQKFPHHTACLFPFGPAELDENNLSVRQIDYVFEGIDHKASYEKIVPLGNEIIEYRIKPICPQKVGGHRDYSEILLIEGNVNEYCDERGSCYGLANRCIHASQEQLDNAIRIKMT